LTGPVFNESRKKLKSSGYVPGPALLVVNEVHGLLIGFDSGSPVFAICRDSCVTDVPLQGCLEIFLYKARLPPNYRLRSMDSHLESAPIDLIRQEIGLIKKVAQPTPLPATCKRVQKVADVRRIEQSTASPPVGTTIRNAPAEIVEPPAEVTGAACKAPEAVVDEHLVCMGQLPQLGDGSPEGVPAAGAVPQPIDADAACRAELSVDVM
jgi:hypothetical protein